MAKFHTHEDEHGFMVKCYHKSKSVLLSASFWLGVTVSFPIEHFLWTQVPGFSHLSHAVGLIEEHK